MARRLSGIRVEQHGQPGNGAFVKLSFTAHVTDPGGEVGDHDQFLSQPGEIGDVPQMGHASGAFTAGKRMGGGCGNCLKIAHLILKDF